MEYVLKYGNKAIKYNGRLVYFSELGKKTIRFLFEDNTLDPSSAIGDIDCWYGETYVKGKSGVGEWVKVANHPLGNVWDCVFPGNTLTISFCGYTEANAKLTVDNVGYCHILDTGDMEGMLYYDAMFRWCTAIKTVRGFDFGNTGKWEYAGSGGKGTTNMFAACNNMTSIKNLRRTQNLDGFSTMFDYCTSLTEVELFNTASAYSVELMFRNCNKLESLPLFNFKNLVNMSGFALDCSSLKTIPAYNVSNVTDATTAFDTCENVESGILDMYNALSSTGKCESHGSTFSRCGTNTTSGSAELAQIPSDWK